MQQWIMLSDRCSPKANSLAKRLWNELKPLIEREHPEEGLASISVTVFNGKPTISCQVVKVHEHAK